MRLENAASEEVLLTRIETLEAQLAVLAGGLDADGTKKALVVAYEEREAAQNLAGDAVRRAQLDKAEALAKLGDTERALGRAEEELSVLKAAATPNARLLTAVDAVLAPGLAAHLLCSVPDDLDDHAAPKLIGEDVSFKSS